MPKFTRMPLEQLDAIDNIWPSCASFSFSSLAAAAAAPNVPMVPDEWKPAVVMLGIDRFGDLALDLEADQNASRNAAPDSPMRSEMASAADSGDSVGCVSSPNVRSGVVDNCVSS